MGVHGSFEGNSGRHGESRLLKAGVLLVLALVLLTGRVTIAFVTFVGLAAVLNIFFAYLTVRDYTFGMIESIAITIFIGFACDYCVHIAQTHICTIAEIGSLDAVHKIKRTLGHAGPALFSSALTTAGSALPLLFCNIFVFRQMGEFIAVLPSKRSWQKHSLTYISSSLQICTTSSFVVTLTLLVPLLCVTNDISGRSGSATNHNTEDA